MEQSRSNISVGARVAALSALLLASLILIVAIFGVFDGGDGSPADEGTTTSVADVPKNYEVRSGDTLSAIAEKTGVPMSTIEELNPDIDPQALIEGQKLKLR
jgi:nucleoid-associated protein YgaU